MTPLIEAQLVAFFDAHTPQGTVADAGAGSDDAVWRAMGDADVNGVELHRYDLAGGVDLCATALPLRYSTIVCNDVLEHVLDPFAVARNLVRSLDPGGWLYVTTVFAFEHHDYPIDMWRFTTTALDHLFTDGSPWIIDPERIWYEDESSHPEMLTRRRVSLIGQRPASATA